MQRVSVRVGIQLGVDRAQSIDVRHRQAVLNGACDHTGFVPREWQDVFIDVGCDVGRCCEQARLAFDQDDLLLIAEAESFGTGQMLLLMGRNLVQNATDNGAWLCSDDVTLA
jgi:hypothetical protein